MPTPTTYTYTQTVAIDRLTQEIQASSIVTALDHIDTVGSTCNILFKDVLSETDQTTLATVMAAHSGLPLPNVQQVTVQNALTTTIASAPPFAAKSLSGKKLYKRIVGVQQSMAVGANTVLFTIPYNWVKFTGIQIVNGNALDTASLYVLDSITGTYTTVANTVLNQFGFNVNVNTESFEFKSEFDADLYIGMRIKIIYTALTVVTVGINFVLNELK